MLKQLLISGAVTAALMGSATAAPLADEVDNLRLSAMPLVQDYADGYLFETPGTTEFQVMIVNVYDQAGNEVLNTRSKGEPVELFADTLPDGHYRYEITVVSNNPLASPADVAANLADAEIASREFGSFEVKDGERVIRAVPEERSGASLWQSAADQARSLAAGWMSWVANEAVAQNVTVDSGVPTIFFEDTNDVGQVDEFRIIVNGNFFGLYDDVDDHYFLTYDSSQFGSAGVNSIDINANGDVALASGGLFVDRSADAVGINTSAPSADLDIHDTDPDIRLRDVDDATEVEFNLSGDDMRFWGQPSGGSFTIPFRYDVNAPSNSLAIAADGDVGIGTSTPLGNLDISGNGFLAELVIHSASANFWDINAGGAGLWFTNGVTGGSNATVKIANAAPFDSLTVDPTGEVGIGTNAPNADLNIRRGNPSLSFTNTNSGNNDSQTLVFSNNFLRIQGANGQDLGKMHTLAPVGSFTTDSKGRTGYGTANPGASFNVKYRAAHGAVPIFLAQDNANNEKFSIAQNGTVRVNGAVVHASDANMKTNLVSLNYAEILDKVAALPIQQWQYKDAMGVNHIGPMAQDFFATFGLGDTDKGIATVDSSGVALAAIKALAIENAQLKAQVGALQADRERLATLEAVVAELAAEQTQPVLVSAK